MSEVEVYSLPDGGKVSTGLLLPKPGEMLVMGEYPRSMRLDRKDIKRSLAQDRYKQRRQKFAKWMLNQSTIGKCCASANIGGFYTMMDQQGFPHAPLADNHLYWRCNGGVDEGCALATAFREIQKGGVSRRTIIVDGKTYRIPDLVYSKRQLPPGVAAAADADGKNFVACEAYKVPKDWTGFVETVASALARDQVIVWAWDVTNAGMKLRNGYMQCGKRAGNHANLLQSARWVEASALEDCVHPDNRNSWGPTMDAIYGPVGSGWGDNGYGLVTMQDAYTCINYHDFYVITSILASKPISPI